MLAYVGLCWFDVGPMLAYVGPILAHVGPVVALCWPMWAPSWPRLGPMLAPCWPILGPMSGLCWRYPRPSMLKDLQDANFSVPDPQDSRETQSLPLSSNRIDPQVLPICSLQSLLVGIL